MNLSRSHIFWGSHSPLGAFFGTGLIIMTSTRTAFALVIAAALLWVYGLTVPVYFASARFFPARGKAFIPIFLSAFFGSIFHLLVWFFNPLLAMELGLLISLVPVCCIGSEIFSRLDKPEPGAALSRALGEAAVLGLLILALALIREPLGYASLSLPGGARGIVEFFGDRETGAVFPVRAVAVSSGGFLLLGYALAVFRHFRARFGGRGE